MGSNPAKVSGAQVYSFARRAVWHYPLGHFYPARFAVEVFYGGLGSSVGARLVANQNQGRRCLRATDIWNEIPIHE